MSSAASSHERAERFRRRPLSARDERFGAAFGDQTSAFRSGPWAQIDQMIGRRHDREVMLDGDHTMAALDELIERANQKIDLAKVQAPRRLVEEIKRAAPRATRELTRKPKALRLA